MGSIAVQDWNINCEQRLLEFSSNFIW